MVDPADAEHVERLPHIARRPFLAGVRGEEKSGVSRAAENVLEFARRISGFRGIEADADDLVLERERGIQSLLGVRLVEMAQEAHDQARPHAELALRIGDGAIKPVDHGGEGNAASSVALRIEEHFHVPDIVGMRPLQVGEGQVVEILLGDQDRHALIIDVEKILQVAEPVSLAHRVHRFIF